MWSWIDDIYLTVNPQTLVDSRVGIMHHLTVSYFTGDFEPF